jgi:ELWxxDGT repeat protein
MVPLFEGGGRVWGTSSSGLDFVSSADLTTSTVVASLRSPLGLTSVVGGKLVFGCELQSETVGLEPCVLDTSTSKLSVVKDINLNTQNARIGSATPWNDGVIFTSTDPTTSRVTLALAKRSELTTLGTFSTLQGAFSDLEVEALPRLGNKLFFVAQGAQTSQAEPWVTDGTPAGTQRLAKVLASRASGGGAVAVGNLVYFTGSNGSSGDVLYRTDGTEAGTVPASNKRPFGALRVLGDSVMFATSDGTFYRTSPAGEAAITGPGFSVVSARTTATKAFLSKDKDLYAYDAATGLNKIATFPQPSFLVATTPTKAFIGASTGAPDNRYDLWVRPGVLGQPLAGRGERVLHTLRQQRRLRAVHLQRCAVCGGEAGDNQTRLRDAGLHRTLVPGGFRVRQDIPRRCRRNGIHRTMGVGWNGNGHQAAA